MIPELLSPEFLNSKESLICSVCKKEFKPDDDTKCIISGWYTCSWECFLKEVKRRDGEQERENEQENGLNKKDKKNKKDKTIIDFNDRKVKKYENLKKQLQWNG